MESHGEHKRSKPLIIFWMVIGIGIGIVIGASTHGEPPLGDPSGWVLGLTSGIIMGGLLAFFATKPGVDQ